MLGSGKDVETTHDQDSATHPAHPDAEWDAGHAKAQSLTDVLRRLLAGYLVGNAHDLTDYGTEYRLALQSVRAKGDLRNVALLALRAMRYTAVAGVLPPR
ncbi:hypothetical protein [Mycobacteroides abscessus]|uniref:hypothetical protein n=1 Tax=Mycobacteroides abscessus TaxID=36809 RepID=UPI0013000EE9|nr:hypothetical protein [Mycobacteroides abscessus]